MHRLSDLPNISRKIEQLLLQVGIDTPEKLRFQGSEKAYKQIRSLCPDACFNLLLALEGAIQNKNWRNLSPQVKNYLQQVVFFYENDTMEESF
jgi:DNA transformation protein